MKVVVAHPFQQHSFRTAVAIKKTGYLYKYITTVYQKNISLTSFITCFLSKENLERAKSRKCADLCDGDVILLCEWANLILLLLQRIDHKGEIYKWWYWITIHLFNQKLYKYIKKNRIDVVVVYDTVSAELIEKIKENNLPVKIVVDMSAPNALYMKKKFEDEAKDIIYSVDVIEKLNSDDYLKRKCQNAEKEIAMADLFLVASEFTKKSLIYQGCEENKIFKCIYGVYEEITEDVLKYKDNQKIRYCVLGTVSLQKGTYRLLHVINRIKRKDVEFHFWGTYDSSELYYRNADERCYFHGHVPHDKMLEALKQMDVIIFPSFADGFGLSVTEALCRGNIAICSKNAGVSELIIEGENGYTYDPNDDDTVCSLIETLQLDKIRNMQKKASCTLENYTWENYAKYIRVVFDVLKEKGGNN